MPKNGFPPLMLICFSQNMLSVSRVRCSPDVISQTLSVYGGGASPSPRILRAPRRPHEQHHETHTHMIDPVETIPYSKTKTKTKASCEHYTIRVLVASKAKGLGERVPFRNTTKAYVLCNLGHLARHLAGNSTRQHRFPWPLHHALRSLHHYFQ